MPKTPTSFLSKVRDNWEGILALVAVLLVGWYGHARWDDIINAPQAHTEIRTTIDSVATESRQTDNMQWEAIQGILRVQNSLIENQTRLICNMKDVDFEECMPTTPATPFTLPDSTISIP